MQSLYTYTKYFQPSGLYDKSFTQKMIRSIDNLNMELVKNPIEDFAFTEISWEVPYLKPYLNKYNNIIYSFAKMVRVKVMFKDILSEGLTPVKSLLLIGENLRVKILKKLLDHYFKGLFQFEQWIKVNLKHESKGEGYKDIREYASHLIEIQLDTLYIYIKNMLVEDINYTHRLENYVNAHYKLDYKKYKTDNHSYDHAVNRDYHHRRMLI